MLNIEQSKNGDELTVKLEGKITSKTAQELESAVMDKLDGLGTLVFDLEKLEYLTSAGLRVLLDAQQRMEDADAVMKLKNVNDPVMDVFKATGFIEFLTIE